MTETERRPLHQSVLGGLNRFDLPVRPINRVCDNATEYLGMLVVQVTLADASCSVTKRRTRVRPVSTIRLPTCSCPSASRRTLSCAAASLAGTERNGVATHAAILRAC
jgi:hypothetical protein